MLPNPSSPRLLPASPPSPAPYRRSRPPLLHGVAPHLATISLSLLAGCGEPDTGTGTPASGPLGGAEGAGGAGLGGAGGAVLPPLPPPGPIAGLPDDFCERLLAKVCADLVSCGFLGTAAVPACIAQEYDECRGFARTMARAVDRGDATYDPAVYAAAIGGPPGDLCRRGRVKPLYREMFVGKRKATQRCETAMIGAKLDTPRFEDDTCAPGLRCEEGGEGGPGCGYFYCERERVLGEDCDVFRAHCAEGLVCLDGTGTIMTCQPPVAEGAPCDAQRDCMFEQWPGSYTAKLSCIAGTCRAPQPNGASCAVAQGCPECTATDLCVGGACVQGLCVDVAPVGAACKETPEVCGTSRRCVVDGTHPTGACLEVAAWGEPCTTSAECAGQLTCSSGLCDRGPALGEKCDPSDDSCGVGLRCRQGTCLAEPGYGDPCVVSGDPCAFGLFCDPSSRTCGPKGRGVSVPCNPDAEGSCEPGLLCATSEVCLAVGWREDPCVGDDECQELDGGQCVQGKCKETCE